MSSNINFTQKELDFIRENYAEMTVPEMAKELGRSSSDVKTRVQRLGLKKRKDKVWTVEAIKILIEKYSNTPSKEIAELLDCSIYNVHSKAYKLGLRKNEKYLAELHLASAKYLQKSGKSHRFEKGHISWNKGKKIGTRGRTAETQFRKGNRPFNVRVIGSERVSKDGYIEVKVDKTKFWKLKHRIVWEEHYGEIPESHCVCFKDNDPLNCAIENLELISRAELLSRQTVHNLPPELKETVQLLGRLKRQINKKEREYAKE